MILEIDDTKTTADLQDRFSLCFPMLRLEFCRHKHGWQQVCPKKELITEVVPLSAIRKRHDPGIIEMKSWQQVGRIEKEFYVKFGLSVQICYKSGKYWIQTGRSDNVTLDSLVRKTTNQNNRVLL